jgi:uncharacterized protein YbjQ (UPF0145 family)
MTTAEMHRQIEARMVTTALELPGYRVERSLGMVRGIVVRSRSIVGSLGAWLQTFVGGNISLYTSLAERARRDAYQRMLDEAARLGASGVVCVRYDATDIGPGVTEVLCYGTAVMTRPL